MEIVVLVVAAFGLLVAAALLASLIDRRAGWSRVPLEGGSEPDELRVRER